VPEQAAPAAARQPAASKAGPARPAQGEPAPGNGQRGEREPAAPAGQGRGWQRREDADGPEQASAENGSYADSTDRVPGS
jgi:hypothetical protein